MDYIRELRKTLDLSQNDFAKLLGVSIASLRRWENGDNKPSPLAMERIRYVEKEINCGHIDILLSSLSFRQQRYGFSEKNSRLFSFCGNTYSVTYMPYVYNGPSDQVDFYNRLISLQEHESSVQTWSQYERKLSIVQDSNSEYTSQYMLEQPKPSSKSWSSDVGAHGWHRYVGRFPAQLVRCIINYFDLTNQDTILDPFCGSGTTTVEARLLGIPAIGIEISPLSALIARVKSCFPEDVYELIQTLNELKEFYHGKYTSFLGSRDIDSFTYYDIMNRDGNFISPFKNIEKWYTKEALLGTSIVVEFIHKAKKSQFTKDALTVALSAKMRSIGNVDVDVVRAEYRKTPRSNVDVLKLVSSQVRKMIKSIQLMTATHSDSITAKDNIRIITGDCLSVNIPPESISAIITSPPYGTESLSYLRTHLLSFRSLDSILGVDPYNFGDGVIGSEYSSDYSIPSEGLAVFSASQTCRRFFSNILKQPEMLSFQSRINMMAKFFEDMFNLIRHFSIWLQQGGKVAFVIGNKKINSYMIPTNTIMIEIFEYFGFECIDSIAHKLKTNNSNSKVPWQDRIIDNEYIIFFRKL